MRLPTIVTPLNLMHAAVIVSCTSSTSPKAEYIPTFGRKLSSGVQCSSPADSNSVTTTTSIWKDAGKGIKATKPSMSLRRIPLLNKLVKCLEYSRQTRCINPSALHNVRRRNQVIHFTKANRHKSLIAFQFSSITDIFETARTRSKQLLSSNLITVAGGDKDRELASSTRTYSSGSTSRDKDKAANANIGAPQERAGGSSSKFFTDFDDNIIDKMGKNITEYERLVRQLYQINLFHPVKMGLTNMEHLHNLIGAPMNDTSQRFVIHVAGTNGKGSVSLKIAKILEDAGYNTGLFVSPHISSFRERMQVNSVPITEEEVCELLPQIYNLCQTHDIPATFFEVTTALAFRYFQNRNVDAVVLETGLGGRLDATNVVQHPALSIITSIGLEHTRILGDTIDLICFEKAGIIKPNHPTLIGPGVQPVKVVKDVCQERDSELYFSDVLVPPSTLGNNANETGQTQSISGHEQPTEMVDYDVENSRIAKAAIHILETQGQFDKKKQPVTEDNIQYGISHRPPCRFEMVTWTPTSSTSNSSPNAALPSSFPTQQDVQVVLDVAHNPPALEFLLAKLRQTYGEDQPVRFVVGFSSDKDLTKCGNLLLSYLDDVPRKNDDIENSTSSSTEENLSTEKTKRIHLVQAAHPRAATAEQMLEACPGLDKESYLNSPNQSNCGADDVDDNASSIASHVKSALNIASQRNEVVVICGSVFIMSDAREALGINEARDSNVISEVAGINLRHGQENFGNSTNLK